MRNPSDTVAIRYLLEREEYKRGKKIGLLLHIFFYKNNSFNLQYITQQYAKIPANRREGFKSIKALYHRFNRLVKQLVKAGFLAAKKAGKKTIYYTPTPKMLDLIIQAQNSNQRKMQYPTWLQFPQRARPERLDAINITAKTQLLTISDREKINDLLNEYIEDIDNRIIILKGKELGELWFGNYLTLKYKTRINSKAKKMSILEKYNKIINESLKRYKAAVHLTLTTNPALFSNLWEANRHFSIALNKFFSFLTKRLGERPSYLAVYEYTQTGLCHAHILIFGKAWLLKKEDITKEWERCGQGTVNYIYALHNTGKGWHYKRDRPNEVKKGESANDYLKKYLQKSFNNQEADALYWVFNKRYYTYSRDLTPEEETPRLVTGIFEFIGSFNIYYIPDWIVEDMPTAQIWYKEVPPR